MSAGRRSRAKRGLGSIIAAAFIVLILISGLTFYTLILRSMDSYNATASEMNQADVNRSREQLTITAAKITSENKLNLTVTNTGSLSSRLLWLGLFNQSVTPEAQWFFELNQRLEPAETKTILSDFSVARDQKYVVQIATAAGNTFTTTFYPASAVQCTLTLVAGAPTVYVGNNITLFLAVTHNDTEVDVIQNITVSLQQSPLGLVTATEQPTSLTVESLRRGETAFFRWIYTAASTGTVTFNATYNQAPTGAFALATVNIENAPSGSGAGQIDITGVNGSSSFYPSQWSTVGGTQYVSGLISNLKSSDSNPVVFTSYFTGSGTDITDYVDSNTSNVDGSPSRGTHSNFTAQQYGPDAVYDTLTESFISHAGENATAKTNAFVAYRDATVSFAIPKGRTWVGETASWSAQAALPDAGSPVRWVRIACSTVSSRGDELVVVTLSDDGWLDAYVWNGSSWQVTNNIANTGISANNYRCFDVTYEKSSGRALLVYSRGTTSNEIGYRIWTYGSGWSTEQLMDLPYTNGIVNWIAIASAPGTRAGVTDDNEIAMIYLDSNADVYGYVWTGSVWSNMGATAVWDTTAAISTEECIAVAYEQLSGRAMFIWGDGAADVNNYRIWDGTTLTILTTLTITAQAAVTNWVTLKSNPNSDGLLYLVIDGGSDLNTAYWNGSAWTVHTEHDANVDTNAARCADFAWEPTGSNGILVYGTSAGQITRKTFTAPNTWGNAVNSPIGISLHPWVQLRTNFRNIVGDTKILGVIIEEGSNSIGAVAWDGTTFTVLGSGAISADTGTTNYECFTLSFMNFGPIVDSYQLDLEVQWTNTDFNQTNKWLCIYGGAMNAEPLRVDVWTGSTWQNLLPNLTAGWNNVSVAPYLTSSTFTIRFTGENETSDSVQSSWNIDVVLLHVWTSTNQQYTVEVEFTGATGTASWTALSWSIQTSWTAPQVSVTIQFYNYTAGSYVTGGAGYFAYTSNPTPNVYELKNQLVTDGAADFVDGAGNWKVKIKGVKDTASQFDMNVDWVVADVNYLSSGNTVPYGSWQSYTIKVTSAGGAPIPYSYFSIYANGTSVLLSKNATDPNATISNPGWLQLNAEGEYFFYLRSTSSTSEVFVLNVAVGTTLGQKTIVQEAP